MDIKKSITHLFVTQNIARELKAKGFNEPCFAYIYHGDTIINRDIIDVINPNDSKDYNDNYLSTSLPTIQQVLDWFDTKEIYIQPHLIAQFFPEDGWGYELTYRLENGDLANTDESEFFATRLEATLDAINKAIKFL
jgi:hypothetical protein